jgi:hypothetical protein
MSLRAKRNPFGAVLHGAKGALLILQRQVQLRLREPKTETMLAWGASFLLTSGAAGIARLPLSCAEKKSFSHTPSSRGAGPVAPSCFGPQSREAHYRRRVGRRVAALGISIRAPRRTYAAELGFHF